jgi:hypothetical protein
MSATQLSGTQYLIEEPSPFKEALAQVYPLGAEHLTLTESLTPDAVQEPPSAPV